jgi:hypothetical protein
MSPDEYRAQQKANAERDKPAQRAALGTDLDALLELRAVDERFFELGRE